MSIEEDLMSDSNKKEGCRLARPVRLTSAEYVALGCEVMELTQREAAKRAGISEQALSDIIKGRRPIGAHVAKKLSPVIRVPVWRLLGDMQEQALRDDLLKHIKRARTRINRSKAMGEETQRYLLKELESMESDIQCSA